MVVAAKGVNVPSFVELLCEDLPTKLSCRNPPLPEVSIDVSLLYLYSINVRFLTFCWLHRYLPFQGKAIGA